MKTCRSWLPLILLLIGLTASSCGEISSPSSNENVPDEQTTPAESSATETPSPSSSSPQQNNKLLVVVVYKKNLSSQEQSRVDTSLNTLDSLQQEYSKVLEFITESSEPPSPYLTGSKTQAGDVAKFLEENKTKPIAVAVFNRAGKKISSPGLPGFQTPENYKKHFDDALIAGESFRQSTQSDTANKLDGNIPRDLEGRLSLIEQKQAALSKTLEDFPFSSLGTLLVIIGLSSLLTLGLAVWNILQNSRQDKDIMLLQDGVRSVAQTKLAAPVSTSPTKQTGGRSLEVIEELRQQLEEVREQNRINFAQNTTRLGESERQLVELVIALREVARWMGERPVSDGDAAPLAANRNARSSVVSEIMPLAEEARRVSERVEPLRLAMRDTVEYLYTRRQASGEISERLQALNSRVGLFAQLHRDLSERLKSAQTDATGELVAQLDAERQRLAQIPLDQLSLPRLVKQYRELNDKITAANQDGAKASLPTINGNEIQERLDGTPEELMNWFDDFYQLLNQMKALPDDGTPFDAEVLRSMAQVHRTAREVLNSFDIQPEEIIVGHTLFNHLLHKAVHVRQSSQHPTNTIIEVQRSGFHRASSGEVLRSPQVVIAGTNSSVRSE